MKNTNSQWLIKQPINMAYMLTIQTFAQTNSEIATCLRKKHREMFKARWFVAWFRENKEFFRPALFDNPVMRQKLEQFLIDMSDMLLLFNFAGYYCIKNMEKWILSDPDNYLTTLPFGIIPMRSSVTNSVEMRQGRPTLYGSYVYYTNTQTMKEMLSFECSDDSLKRNYTFGVFNNGAKFVPLNDSISPLANLSSSYGEIVPVSPFAALYRRKSLIEEAIEDEYDANFALSHPQTFVTPHHIPDSKVTDISEGMYYGADTLSGARQNDNAAKQLHATQSVRWLVSKLNHQANGGRREDPENMIRNSRKSTHGRPDMTEGIHTIAGYVDITQTHAPTVIVNIDTAQNQFEEEVCNIVGLPFIFFRNDSGVTARSSGTKGGGGGHSATNEEQLNFYKTVLYEEMENIFNMLNRLFDDVYMQTYHHIDVYTLASHYASEEEKRVKFEAKKEKMKQRMRREADKEEEMMADMVIDLESMAKTQLSGIRVVLRFEKMVARSTASLNILKDLCEQGIVTPAYMKKYVELIFGPEDELIYSQEKKKGM